MKKLLSLLFFVGLLTHISSVQAVDKKFKLQNNTGYEQTISDFYLTNDSMQTLAGPLTFTLAHGVSQVIDIPDNTANGFNCQLHASSPQTGEKNAVNSNVSSFIPGTGKDVYELKYNSMLDFMTITKKP